MNGKPVSKDSNKVKVFGAKGEYNSDTAGIINYKKQCLWSSLCS